MTDTTVDRTLADTNLRTCPHCGATMLRWYTKPEMSWGTPYQFVCFNDDCEYFIKGWEWMQTKFNKKVSYRHRFNPFDGTSGPVPVWSRLALRVDIMEDGEDVDDFLRRTGRLTT